MKELGVYPGSFRPFHCEHLVRVRAILSAYPNQNLIIAVADECLSPKKYDIICSRDALEIVFLVIGSEQLGDRVWAQLVTVSSDIPQGLCRVFTGSERTIKMIQSLKENKIWNGEVVRLDNSGVHGEQIRRLIVQNDSSWKEYVHPSVIDYLENIGQNFLDGPKS